MVIDKAMVTGAYGFIGSHLTKALEANGTTVFPIGRRDSVYDIKDKVSVIYHCADVAPDESFPRGDNLLENLDLTREILHYWKFQQPDARLIGMNSIWAYPSQNCIFNETQYWDGPMIEWQAHYGIIKKTLMLGIEAFKHQTRFHGANKMSGTMLTLGNVYGPGDTSNRIIQNLRFQMEQNPRELMIGRANGHRNFIYIEDQVQAIIAATKYCSLPLINLGLSSYSIYEVAKILAQLTGYPGTLMFDENQNSPGSERYMDSSLSHNSLDIWKDIPIHSLEEGLKKTVASWGIHV